MDFLHRNANSQARSDTPATFNSVNPGDKPGNFKQSVSQNQPTWLKVTSVVLLFSLAIVAVAVTILLSTGKAKEISYVDDTKAQAVFLTNGQVYFGKISSINAQYVDLQDIYYLNTEGDDDEANQNRNTNFSLVKLGCELHGPADQMLINREQITFWENLKADGKVAKAIKQWRDQNPNGQTCSDTNSSNSTQQSTTPGTENSSGANQ